MKKIIQFPLLSAVLCLTFNSAFAAETSSIQGQTPDAAVQHLKLDKEQLAKIQALHQKLADDTANIPRTAVKDGVIIGIIQSGKWDDASVKKQLMAYSSIDQQSRYYKVKYYFDLNLVLTPEQRQQVREDLARAASE